MFAVINHLDQVKDKVWFTHFKKALMIGALFHLSAVIFSDGFHRPDEHLGIMRFTGFKLGLLNEEQAFSSWEYPARIRPWLQPMLYTMFVYPFKVMGLENPFFIATLLRFFSSLLGFGATSLIAFISYDFSKNLQIRLLTLYSCFLLWFIPFFHARTSSENLASSFFTFAFILVYANRHRGLALLSSSLIGFLFSISFILRYQTSISIFFLCLWLLLINKEKIRNLFVITSVFFVVLALSSLIDFWGYGEWTNPAYNYFYENIVNSKADQFGVDPWWKYLSKSLTKGIPPVSILYFLASFYFWFKKPLHIITWVTLPFLVVHSLIAHKELRFLFPIFIYLPLVVPTLLDRFHLRPTLIKSLVVVNCFALVIATLKPVYSPLGLYKSIYRQKPIIEVVYTTHHIRDQLHFYMRDQTRFDLLQQLPADRRQGIWIMSDSFKDYDYYSGHKQCDLKYSTYPSSLVRNYRTLFKRSKITGLHFCKSL